MEVIYCGSIEGCVCFFMKYLNCSVEILWLVLKYLCADFHVEHFKICFMNNKEINLSLFLALM